MTERLLELRLGEFATSASCQVEFRELQQEIELELRTNQEDALEIMASKYRNREFQEYYDNAQDQSKAAHAADHL